MLTSMSLRTWTIRFLIRYGESLAAVLTSHSWHWWH